MFKIAAQLISLALPGVEQLGAVALIVDESYGKVLGAEAYGDAVYEQNQAWQEEHKEKEEEIPLHGDPVLYAQSCSVRVGGEGE